jgi:hypothetical protein
MKKITVQLGDNQEIVVSELPLIKYSELIKSLQVLPKKLSQLTGKDSNQIVEVLPLLISEALPDFVNIIAIATSLKPAEIEALGLSAVTKIVEAIIEVNDYEYLFNLVKKALARYQADKTSLKSLDKKTTGSGGQ